MLMRQLAAILILPFNVLLLIPTLLHLRCRGKQVGQLFPAAAQPFTWAMGGVLILTGLPLLAWTIREFGRSGRGHGGAGTLAPWDPPKELLIRGPYRHVRNPMISAVMAILFGQALLLNSLCHLVWAVFFTLGNMVYIPRSEEPSLQRRFGDDYGRYQRHVPRWLPQRRQWDPHS